MGPEDIKKTLVTAIEKAVKNLESKPKGDKVGYLVDDKSPAELNRLKKEEYQIASALAVRMGLWK